jgi:hypothetical protein
VFTKSELKQFGSASLLKRLEQKQSGGAAGKAGYRYEDYFLVLRLAEATAPSAMINPKVFRIQEGAYCPVDDVVIKNGQFDFFQLKTSPRTRWSGALLKDFEAQIKLCNKKKLSYRLHLVVPKKDQASRLFSKRPNTLKSSTDTIFFPTTQRRTDLWRNSGPLNPALCQICADPSTPPEALEALATAFEVAWRDCSSMGRFTTLSQVLSDIHKKEDVPLRFEWKDSSPKWKTVEGILQGIHELQYDTSRGFFCYSSTHGESGRFKCGTASYRRFLDRVIKFNPTTFDAFMETLP